MSDSWRIWLARGACRLTRQAFKSLKRVDLQEARLA